jgi:gluconokinase
MHAPSSTFTTPTRTPTSSVAEEDEDVELDDKAHVRALQLLKSNAPASREEYKATIDPDAEVVLVVDIGSTSIKCSAFVADELVEQPSTPTAGAAVACDNGGKSKDLPDGMARRRTILELHFAAQRAPSPTFTEQGYIADARVVLSQVEAVVEACLQRLREAGVRRVTKFGFSSLVMNLFGVDLLGQPVTPVFTYASSEPHAAHFNPSFHERFDHHALTGTSMHHPSYALVQLKAFYERFPEIAASVHQWTTLSSYILGCWTTTSPSMGARTGVEIPMHTSSIDTSFEFCPVSFSEASWTGLFKTDDLSWCGKALHYLPGLRANTLPRLCDFNDYLGHTRSSLAARWPELQGCRFHLGIGDGAAANLGSAAQCLAEGFAVDACVSVGTSAAVRVLVGSRAHSEVSPPVPLGLWCYRVDRNRCLVGGALTDGGSLVEWFGHCFGRDALAAALEDLEELVLREQESEAWKPAPGSGMI